MSKKGKILYILGILLIVLLCVLYCLGVYFSHVQKLGELSEKEAQVTELKGQLDDLIAEYNLQVENVYESEKGINLSKANKDIEFLNDVLKPCFEFVDSKEYTNNRNKLLKVAPSDSNLFTDYIVKNDESLGGNNIDVSGLKMECKKFDVFIVPNEKNLYYVVLDYLPYIDEDNLMESSLMKQRLIIMVKMNSNGKKIDDIVCYKSDSHL